MTKRHPIQLQPIRDCADCGVRVGLSFAWPARDCARLWLCGSCSFARSLQDEDDKKNAVLLAQTIVAMWNAFARAEQALHPAPTTIDQSTKGRCCDE